MSPKSPDSWRDVYAAVLGTRDSTALVNVLSRQVEALRFRYWSYGVQLPVSATAPVLALFDRYPAGWMIHYRQCNYIETDPTVRIGRKRCSAVIWSDDVFASSVQLWREARDAGLRVGVAHPSWGPAGSYGEDRPADGEPPSPALNVQAMGVVLPRIARVLVEGGAYDGPVYAKSAGRCALVPGVPNVRQPYRRFAAEARLSELPALPIVVR